LASFKAETFLTDRYFGGIFFLSFFQIEGHDDDVNTVAFADSTSQILYSGGDDGLCKVTSAVIYISITVYSRI
jgi:WD40 repeat protein